MFSSFKRKLISEYPLIWNTRAYIIIPLALIINILFYLAGFSEPITLEEISRSRPDFDSGLIQFSVLVTILVVILWLSYYLRNNAFKNFYPVRHSYLLCELFIILLTFFLASSYPYSYEAGVYSKIRNTAAGTDVKREAEILGIAQNFLAFEKQMFAESLCDSTPDNNPEGYEVPIMPGTGYSSNPENEVYLYSNFCTGYINYNLKELGLDRQAISKRAKTWIRTKNQDSISWVLNETVKLVRKYGGDNRLNVEQQVNDILDDTVGRVIRPNIYYDGKADYLSIYTAFESISIIKHAGNGYWQGVHQSFVGFLYYILIATILLFTFRLTRLRTWFKALIALGILIVVFIIIGLGGLAPDMIFSLYLLIWAACFIFLLIELNSGMNKNLSGIALLWFFWVLPSVPVSLAAWYTSHDHEQHWNEPDTLEYWITHHWMQIHYGTIIMTILVMALLLIPLARRWQASPEE